MQSVALNRPSVTDGDIEVPKYENVDKVDPPKYENIQVDPPKCQNIDKVDPQKCKNMKVDPPKCEDTEVDPRKYRRPMLQNVPNDPPMT